MGNIMKANIYLRNIQDGMDISVIIVTDDYLYYKELKMSYNFFSYFTI